LNKENLKISEISENKQKPRSSKLINNCIQIYSGVDSSGNERSRAGVALTVHKTLQNKTDNYIYNPNIIGRKPLQKER
jgi:hypothetical protein